MRGKGKKNEDSRNAAPVCGASDCRIWRIFDDARKRWVHWKSGVTSLKLVNSRVHRHGREAGYPNGEDESHFDGHLKAVDGHLKAVEERLRDMSYLKKSGPWRAATNQGDFECCVLKAHPTDPRSKFLLETENSQPGVAQTDVL